MPTTSLSAILSGKSSACRTLSGASCLWVAENDREGATNEEDTAEGVALAE